MRSFRTAQFAATAAFIVSPVLAEADTCPFQEQNGEVVIEVEAEPPNGGWSSKTSLSSYKGSSYYEWDGPNHFSKPGEGTLTYKVKINNAGNYQFMFRSQIAVGDDGKEHNDSWVRMSGTPISGQHPINKNQWYKAFMSFKRWSWQTRTGDESSKALRQYFSEGTHTIEISGRSKGHAIDRFILFKYADKSYEDADKPFEPSASGGSAMTNLPASSCNGGGGTTTTTMQPPTTTTMAPTTTTTEAPTTTTTMAPTTTTTMAPTTTTTMAPTTTTTTLPPTTTTTTTTTTSTTTTTILVTTTSVPPSSTTSTTMMESVPGDLNGDGVVTVTDALLTLKAAIGGGECELCLCDLNGDGELTVEDGLMVLFRAVGREIETNLPACS